MSLVRLVQSPCSYFCTIAYCICVSEQINDDDDDDDGDGNDEINVSSELRRRAGTGRLFCSVNLDQQRRMIDRSDFCRL